MAKKSKYNDNSFSPRELKKAPTGSLRKVGEKKSPKEKK